MPRLLGHVVNLPAESAQSLRGVSPDSQAAQAMQAAADRVGRVLREMGSVLVALSGGVDSRVLLALAVRELGADHVVAATAVDDVYPAGEAGAARRAAAAAGVRHLEVRTGALDNEEFLANRPDRCYVCRAALCVQLGEAARAVGCAAVVDGTNADDLGDYRPGIRAAREAGVRSPLAEAGVTKAQIRALCASLGLGGEDAPSSPCLASRLPYGERVSREGLARIDAGEQLLRDLGFREVRVRDHGGLARIEVPAEAIPTMAALPLRERVVGALKALGFAYVSLDMQGLRSGSMNEVLPLGTGSGERV